MHRFAAACLVSACTSTPVTPPDDTDACVAADTGPQADCGALGRVEIGTGADAFVAHADGASWPLQHGSQGLQHVMLSVRAPIDPTTLPVPRAAVTVGAWRVEDGLAVASAFTSGWELSPVEGGAEIVGVRVVLPVIDDVVDHEVGFDVRIMTVGSTDAWHGWATGTVAWVDAPLDTDAQDTDGPAAR